MKAVCVVPLMSSGPSRVDDDLIWIAHTHAYAVVPTPLQLLSKSDANTLVHHCAAGLLSVEVCKNIRDKLMLSLLSRQSIVYYQSRSSVQLIRRCTYSRLIREFFDDDHQLTLGSPYLRSHRQFRQCFNRLRQDNFAELTHLRFPVHHQPRWAVSAVVFLWPWTIWWTSSLKWNDVKMDY